MIGVVGGFIASLFGGWDAALMTLVIFMGIDYVTGLIVAGVFHNSEKTANGALESRAGWKGLCRKGVTLLVVLVACRLDLVMGSNFIRDAVVIAFIANETISIIENAGLMGIPIPSAIMKAIDILKNKGTIYLCGNGGSAADAQHIAAEFVGRFYQERKGLSAEALTVNTSILTGISNDYSFERVFVRQLEAKAHAGDMLIGISTSGTSKNILAILYFYIFHCFIAIIFYFNFLFINKLR